MALIAFTDLEASGLGQATYPIEVAYAEADDEALTEGDAGSWLIAPTEDWRDYGSWDPAAESLHGLTFDRLVAEGVPVEEVARRMNARFSGVPVFSDSPLSDANWCGILFEWSPEPARFALLEFRSLITHTVRLAVGDRPLAEIRPLIEEARTIARQAHPIAHRALPDALRLRTQWLHIACALRDNPNLCGGGGGS